MLGFCIAAYEDSYQQKMQLLTPHKGGSNRQCELLLQRLARRNQGPRFWGTFFILIDGLFSLPPAC